MFPYDYLAEFSVVARTGSLSRAALELSLSHSSLSRHIRTLETILGVTLVTRTSEGVELTEDGRYVANRANDIVNIAEDLTYHMSKLRNVGRMPVYGLASLGTLRAQFESTAHALSAKGERVQIVVLPDEAITGTSAPAMVESGKARVFVDFDHSGLFDRVDAGRFHRELLTVVDHVALVEPGHPLASKAEIAADDLDGMVLMYSNSFLDQAGSYWESLRHSLRELGIHYTAFSKTLLQDTDWMNDHNQGIVIVADGFDPIELMRREGKLIIPVKGIPQTISAVCRADDTQAIALAQAVRRRIEGEQGRA